MRFESQGEGELGMLVCFAFLVDAAHVGETHLLDVFGLGGEFGGDGFQCHTLSPSDVRGEIIAEEVPVSGLTFDTVHRNKIGRVVIVSQEFQAHTGSKRSINCWSSC